MNINSDDMIMKAWIIFTLLLLIFIIYIVSVGNTECQKLGYLHGEMRPNSILFWKDYDLYCSEWIEIK